MSADFQTAFRRYILSKKSAKTIARPIAVKNKRHTPNANNHADGRVLETKF
jgi:hypothetical protein